jgi:hypothetical protein
MIDIEEAKRQFADLSPEERQIYVQNKLAVPITRMIIEPMLANDGGAPEIMLMLESVNVGVMLTLAKQQTCDVEGMWQTMVHRVHARIGA